MRPVKDRILRAVLHLILIMVALFAIYPVFVMLAGSFKSSAELLANASGLPESFNPNNYKRLLNYNSGIILRTFFNSLFISITYTALTIFAASLAGFAFAKYQFKCKNIIFLLLLITMMIPAELNMTPLYLIFSKLHWLNTYQVQILPGIANVFALFMFRQYMESIPTSLIEAARIDGAGHWKIYRDIIVPTSVPAIGALSILTFLGKWNDFLFPKLMVDKIKYMPIMVILPTLNETDSARAVPWELVLTGCTLVTVPLIIMFLLFQDKFLSSVTIGAVKG